MARKAKSKGKKPSILGTGWRGGSFKAAVGGYLKKKVAKLRKSAGKSLKKGARKALKAK
ncbi:MAG: hypothetical protein ACOYNY_41585 [Caldilineaceae bacterium]|jgi:hypothetical protein